MLEECLVEEADNVVCSRAEHPHNAAGLEDLHIVAAAAGTDQLSLQQLRWKLRQSFDEHRNPDVHRASRQIAIACRCGSGIRSNVCPHTPAPEFPVQGNDIDIENVDVLRRVDGVQHPQRQRVPAYFLDRSSAESLTNAWA